MGQPELSEPVHWSPTANVYFPLASVVENKWWVLRVNNFPDHPLFTLFVGGLRRFDLDDMPDIWERPKSAATSLSAEVTAEALDGIENFVAYGSEVGRPCDNLFCCG